MVTSHRNRSSFIGILVILVGFTVLEQLRLSCASLLGKAMVGDFQRDLQDQGRRKTPAKTFGIAAFWLGIGGAPMAPMGLS